MQKGGRAHLLGMRIVGSNFTFKVALRSALLPHYGCDILSNVEVWILLVSADDYSEVKLITNLTKNRNTWK